MYWRSVPSMLIVPAPAAATSLAPQPSLPVPGVGAELSGLLAASTAVLASGVVGGGDGGTRASSSATFASRTSSCCLAESSSESSSGCSQSTSQVGLEDPPSLHAGSTR